MNLLDDRFREPNTGLRLTANKNLPMNLTKIAIDNNRVTVVILVLILVMGLLAYNQLSRNSMPPYTVRVCSVVTQFPGASPERVEELVTDRIEKVVQELPELKTLTSESRTGLSIVQVELDPSIRKADLQPVWDRLRRKIEGIRDDLPDGVREPRVEDDGVGDVYGVMLGLLGDGYSNEELKSYAEDIRDDLIKLDDAAKVEIQGVQEEQIFVNFDNARLAEIGLTSGMLQNIIASTNIVFSGGQVSLEGERIVLEPTGNYNSINDLERTLISLPNGQSLELGDFTSITRAYKTPAEHAVRINGKPGITLSVALKDGANLIRLGETIDDRIESYNQSLPIGLSVARMAAQDYYVDVKISDFLNNVIQSVLIVLGVMLLFLGVRTGIVVASLIPMAMVMTLLLMNFFDIGLNQVSLAALIMALGMLVDNAIVVSESIMVKMENGVKPMTAAIDSAGELLVPLLVSSLTTSAAFLAFFLAENTMGEIMGPLFSVITLALLSSWILAMTMITMLGALFIRVNVKSNSDETEEPQKKGLFDRINDGYKVILETVLRRPILFILLIIGLFVGSLSLFPRIPFIFFPDSDRNLVTLDLNLPQGTKIERTEEVTAQIEAYIKKELLVSDERPNGIVDWTAFIGEGPISYDLGYQPGEANSGYAHMLLNTSSFEENNRVIEVLEAYCFMHFPDADVSVGPLGNAGSSGADVEIRLTGSSPDELSRISNEIKLTMNSLEGTKNIKDNWGPKIKKFVIQIDQDKANRAGVSNQDIAISLRTALAGTNSGSFREGTDNIPIIMKSEGSEELQVKDLQGF